LNPAGHFGAVPVTFLMTLPLTHVIVIFFITGLVAADGVGDGSEVTIGFGDGCCIGTGC
jgi:hypothetical protein